MQYSLLLPTDKLKQSLPFSDYKHFDYHSRVMPLYKWNQMLRMAQLYTTAEVEP